MKPEHIVAMQTKNGKRIDYAASWAKSQEGKQAVVLPPSVTPDTRDMRDPEELGRELFLHAETRREATFHDYLSVASHNEANTLSKIYDHVFI